MIVVAYNAFVSYIKEAYPDEKVVVWQGEKLDKKNVKLVVLTGGEDISPRLYNEPTTYSLGINSYRDQIEGQIFSFAYNSGIKILGICRGIQLGCAILGGKLFQDIYWETQNDHPYEHGLDLIEESQQGIFSNFSYVNSLHHQGVKYETLNSSFKVLSMYKGIPEQVETSQFVGVQFHPEMMRNDESKLFFKSVLEWASPPANKFTVPKSFVPSYNPQSEEEIFEFPG